MCIWLGPSNARTDLVDTEGNRVVKVMIRACGEQALKAALTNGQAGCAATHTKTAEI